MSAATIRIPTPLRAFTGGAGEVAVEAATVGAALEALERRHPGILPRLLDERGRLRGFVNVYVGDTNVKSLGGLAAAIDGAAVISIVPAVAGGAR
jgi:molybdopterin converting factor small subunit